MHVESWTASAFQGDMWEMFASYVSLSALYVASPSSTQTPFVSSKLQSPTVAGGLETPSEGAGMLDLQRCRLETDSGHLVGPGGSGTRLAPQPTALLALLFTSLGGAATFGYALSRPHTYASLTYTGEYDEVSTVSRSVNTAAIAPLSGTSRLAIS